MSVCTLDVQIEQSMKPGLKAFEARTLLVFENLSVSFV